VSFGLAQCTKLSRGRVCWLSESLVFVGGLGTCWWGAGAMCCHGQAGIWPLCTLGAALQEGCEVRRRLLCFLGFAANPKTRGCPTGVAFPWVMHVCAWVQDCAQMATLAQMSVLALLCGLWQRRQRCCLGRVAALWHGPMGYPSDRFCQLSGTSLAH
jgi:hypothetical protein